MEWKCGECVGDELQVMKASSDSDWAGCVRSRKSTSGGMVVFGGFAVKHWSATQSTIALSNGEVEYNMLARAALGALGVQLLARDMGCEMSIGIGVDPSTAKRIASRSGLGKVRHLSAKTLWGQQALECKWYLLLVGRAWNPADGLTKPSSVWETQEKLRKVGARLIRRDADTRPGRADQCAD